MTTQQRLQKRIDWLESMKSWLDPTDKQGIEILDELIKETQDTQTELNKAPNGDI